MREIPLAQRLIVAADYGPSPLQSYGVTTNRRRDYVREQVLRLADGLAGTDVIIKMNSALRACGAGLVDDVHSRGLKVFADYKLVEIPNTLSTDGVLIGEVHPELLTVMCFAGVKAMVTLKEELPNTEVLGVTVLTSLERKDTLDMFDCDVETAGMRFARQAVAAGIGGFVCAAKEVKPIRTVVPVALSMSFNTPAIRPAWAIVPGDDQNPDRIMTPAKAIAAGADRIVVGRPITQSPHPIEAVNRTLEEIASALAPS